MAYKKIVHFKIKCEGPCDSGTKFVNQIPSDWRKLKIYKTNVPSGVRPIESETLLCAKCAAFAVDLLEINGFKFNNAVWQAPTSEEKGE